MALLILGLVLFLGAHSTRIFAENWRQAILERLGEKAYKGVYTLVSLVGFGLMVFGFDQVRWDSPLLWAPPVWVKHAAALLMLLSLCYWPVPTRLVTLSKSSCTTPWCCRSRYGLWRICWPTRVWLMWCCLALFCSGRCLTFEPPVSAIAWPLPLCWLVKAVEPLPQRFQPLPLGAQLA